MPVKEEAMPVVRVLHTLGCGNYQYALGAAVGAMRKMGLGHDPVAVLIDGYDDGVVLGFRGSPTVTVDGVDVEPDPPGEPGIPEGCRNYHVPGEGTRAHPPVEMIVAALEQAMSGGPRGD